ncbi:ribonuclease H2 subunit C [Latimeria chalumnae]|uniref:Ribonuclease H2 subunit C n=1 Tax=Latimeria chalumnae TaxID=7897 RepID=H3APD2_LATCH|nr:PREDICTED: ribonuclease H2 subunit C [Latimeria chalumnae]|eukprot:XP_005998166.1 PREDICTED: ribonuclease H2 subunit C [Latimeria chalumnae]
MSGSDSQGSSSVIRVELSALGVAGKDPVHLLPFEIEHDGEANINKYFTPTIRQRKSDLTATFRGRGLKGQEVTVPEGYVGLVLKGDHKPCSEEEDHSLRVKNSFSNFTYWNLETPPTSNDGVVMAMTWTELAEAIHAPVEGN